MTPIMENVILPVWVVAEIFGSGLDWPENNYKRITQSSQLTVGQRGCRSDYVRGTAHNRRHLFCPLKLVMMILLVILWVAFIWERFITIVTTLVSELVGSKIEVKPEPPSHVSGFELYEVLKLKTSKKYQPPAG